MLYFLASFFLSGFLLFQVQPLTSKYILPWFGGTPALWSASLLFFQTLLLGGNAFAHGLVGRLSTRKQGIVSLVLLAISLGLLLVTGIVGRLPPILPTAAWKPQGEEVSVWLVLRILAVAVGFPYLLLSANSPLMQAWAYRRAPDRSPYQLYALSNLGSLLGLLTYPFLVEPLLGLRTQALLWTGGFVVFAACAAYGAITMVRLPPPPAAQHARFPGEGEAAPGIRTSLVWVALAATATVVLLATTNQITQEISVVPLLWVLPLALYLLSFVLCFSGRQWYTRGWSAAAFLVASGLFCWVYYYSPPLVGPWGQVVVYGLVLFLACMMCHGELARLKPSPRYLTRFYLLVSTGGALGGVAVNLLAPAVFAGFWELPLGLLGCWVLLLLLSVTSWGKDNGRRDSWLRDALLLAGIAALGVTTLLYIQADLAHSEFAARSFYGVVRVRGLGGEAPEQQAYSLLHGSTVHGFQYRNGEKRLLPTAYYTEESGVGLAILHHPRRDRGLQVGVIGLGVGTLASYGRPADAFRFYEINRDVIRLAEGEGDFFTYLRDCPAAVEVVEGDGRISLERELTLGDAQRFDLLVVDAFSDQAIPVHLLTKESFEVYLRRLAPDGILALHITNAHLNLQSVVQELAEYFHLGTALIATPGDGGRTTGSLWALVTSNEEFLQLPEIAGRSTAPAEAPGLRIWTDDYTDLYHVLVRE